MLPELNLGRLFEETKNKTYITAIVKVQLSLATNAEKQQMMIYTEDRQHRHEGDADSQMVKIMEGRSKAYFYALVPTTAGYIELLKEAPDQDW